MDNSRNEQIWHQLTSVAAIEVLASRVDGLEDLEVAQR